MLRSSHNILVVKIKEAILWQEMQTTAQTVAMDTTAAKMQITAQTLPMRQAAMPEMLTTVKMQAIVRMQATAKMQTIAATATRSVNLFA